MNFQEFLKQEEESGRFCGHRLIKEAALLFSKEAPSWPFKGCMDRASHVYHLMEGFDGEPTSPKTLVKLMWKCR